MYQNMFCTSILTQKTVSNLLKVSLFQVFISANCCEAKKLTDSQKLSTLITSRIIPITSNVQRPELFQFLLCLYISLVNT